MPKATKTIKKSSVGKRRKPKAPQTAIVSEDNDNLEGTAEQVVKRRQMPARGAGKPKRYLEVSVSAMML